MICSMRWFRMLLILAFSSAIFVACDDDDDDNNDGVEGSNFLPLTAGTYWDFDVVSTDAEGQPIEETRHTQRATVSSSEEFEGRSSSEIVFVRQDNNTEESRLRSSKESNGDIYQYLDLFPIEELDLEGFPDVTLPIGWYLVADIDNSGKWELDRTTIPEFDFPVPGTTLMAKVSGEIIATSERGQVKTFTVDGAEVEAQEYIITVDPALDVTAEIGTTTVTEPLQGDVVVRIFLADGIGIVEYTTDPVVLSVNVGFAPQELASLEGTQRITTSYSIAAE